MCVAQAWHGNTPLGDHGWVSGGSRIADGSGRPMGVEAEEARRIVRGGAVGAQLTLPVGWGWHGKGSVQSWWSEQGGCTLSRPETGIDDSEQSAPKQRKRVNRNHRFKCVIVDGIGGLSEYHNNLEENFQCAFGLESMGRQAQGIPQNLEPWCPGSLRTNSATTHHRAVVAEPTSAEVFERGSWLDHPRSSYVTSIREPPERTGPGARRNLEAARGDPKFFENNSSDDCGFYFGSRVIIKDI